MKTKELVKFAVATGNTYSGFLKRLHEMDIPFNKIDLFVVDEYAGIDYDDERSCTIDLCRDLKYIEMFHQTFFFDAESYLEQLKKMNANIIRFQISLWICGKKYYRIRTCTNHTRS